MSVDHNDFFRENEEEEEEEASDSEGYRPISPLSDDDDDERINGQDLISHVGELNSVDFQTPLPCNGHSSVENGVSNLNLTSDEEEEEKEEEETIRRASELAITRAFREDDSRRSAPLTPENASRIVDAMRGISFPGFPPDWAAHVPEDEWMDRLQGLREPTASRN
ncbi:hypothetical protein ACLOJK_023327 [Asimina triloba]